MTTLEAPRPAPDVATATRPALEIQDLELSYIVRGRRQEIAVRTALGARTVDVLRLVVVEGMKPALIGIAAGVVGALVSATILSRLVFGVSASDPITLTAVSATLAVIALTASLVPAYRASRLDPLQVLRGE